MCAPTRSHRNLSHTISTATQLSMPRRPFQPSGAGWYNAGSNAPISIQENAPMGGFLGLLGGEYVFDAWVGTVGVMGTPTANVYMGQPQTYTATCTADYTWPAIGGGIIIIIFGGGGMIIIIRGPGRRRIPRRWGGGWRGRRTWHLTADSHRQRHINRNERNPNATENREPESGWSRNNRGHRAPILHPACKPPLASNSSL